MGTTLIAGTRVFPATDEETFLADVLIEDNRIAAVSRTPGSLSPARPATAGSR
ncbi:MAG: hypothetical protein AB7E24_04690 [Novosphingobium sp.]